MTKNEISEDQVGFRTRMGCVNQIFNLRLIILKNVSKRKGLCSAFTNLEKACDQNSVIAIYKRKYQKTYQKMSNINVISLKAFVIVK